MKSFWFSGLLFVFIIIIGAYEEDYNNKDEIVYFSAPMIGY
jgi:hypothetical protein